MRRALQDGINQLARAGNDKALLGMALINLHAALEAYFRDQLANEISLYEASEQKRATWQDLINLWENSRGLPHTDRERLFQHNSLRNDIAHGKPFSLTRSQVEEYARFVQDFTGVRVKSENPGRSVSAVPSPPSPTPTANPAPARPPQTAVIKNRGCSCVGRLVATTVAIFLVIIGYLAWNTSLLDGLETTTGESGLELIEEIRATIAAPNTEENKVPPSEREATAVPPTNSRDEISEPKTIIRVTANSNVRLGPSTEDGAIGVAPGDQEYEVLETSPDGDWYKIELEPGKVGWIGSSRVAVIAP